MKIARPLSALTLLALGCALPAQTKSMLVGLTRNTPLLVRQSLDCAAQTCRPALPTPMPPVMPEAGGAAYDATRSGVWLSDGFRVILVDADDCRTLCQPFAAPVSQRSLATGLAFDETKDVLWLSDSANALTQCKAGCPATQVSRCQLTNLPTGHVLAGLASDDVRGLLFYAASAFNTPAIQPSVVYVAKMGDPCNPFCKVQLTSCGTNPLGPVTGLGFDPCTNLLYATDGRQTLAVKLDVGNCTFSVVQCCGGVLPVNDPYVGLDVLPSRATSSGKSCLSTVCGSCTTVPMQHTTIGDPTLGNPAFGLALTSTPNDSAVNQVRAFLLVGDGPCTSPGIVVPPLCGPILVPLKPTPPVVLGPFTPQGTSGCDGAVRVKVPVPVNASLCGIPLSSQFVVTCSRQLAVGMSVSNCLSWMVSGG